VTQATKHHGAELELDPLWHAEPMKFVVQGISQSTTCMYACLLIAKYSETSVTPSLHLLGRNG